MLKIFQIFIKKIPHIDLGILLLVIAVAINFYEFPRLDKSRSDPNWKAIYQYNTSDLIEISYQTNPRLQQRYNPAIALGMIAPGSTIFLPQSGIHSSDELKAQLLSYGKVGKIITKTFDSRSIIGDFDPSPYIIETGDEDYRYKPWGIAIGSNSPHEFIIVEWNSTENSAMDLLIDTSLLSDEKLSEIK